MMRQSLQAVLPEISGNKTSLLRKSVCSDILTLFNSPQIAGTIGFVACPHQRNGVSGR